MAKKVYSKEFKRAAVEQVIGQRHTVASVAQRLGVGYDTLRRWVEPAKFNSPASLVPADLPDAHGIGELEKENAHLRMSVTF